ncbi:MAG: glycerophosphodiester phosphodiesterase [Bacteroidales bacterium]|nr:glycerophosphodiester phosphodiesterase [Bacteroidales bacterium]
MKKMMLILLAGCLLVACGKESAPGPQIVAHRGYWKTEGSAQNSIASLLKAGEIGAYGSEFDVNLTADNELVVNHDFSYKGLVIRESTLADLRNDTLRLDNGELIPTLDEYLEASLQYPEMKLVFELKSKGDPAYEATAIRKSIEAFKRYGVQKRVEFISFSLSACQEFARQMPRNRVEYLGGEMAPAELKKLGINGIDYHHSVFLSKPEWVVEAHEQDMVVNVWTVDDDEVIERMLLLGADQITTNVPERVREKIDTYEVKDMPAF